MKSTLTVAVMALLYSPFARADLFSFKDIEGFEKCLRSTHMVETTRTSSGNQKKYLSKIDIQERCFKRATQVLKSEKKASTIRKWTKLAFKNSDRANAIDLIALEVKRSPKSCNDSEAYDTFLRIVNGPSSKDSKSLYMRAKGAIQTCLKKDKQFKTDFMDEQDATRTGYQYKNVCEILKNEGLIKKCLDS